MDPAAPVRYERAGAVAVLTIDNPPVNALGQPVRQALLDRLRQAEADSGVRAVLLVGAGRSFIAGADIREFGQPPQAPFLPDLCSQIETSPLLVVAAIHGVSLGGGLEIALAADYRVAIPAARVGLPEVRLGLIPGAGGTQRLPRLTGVSAAVDIITSGRQVGAREALELGILDKVCDGAPRDIGLACAKDLLSRDAPRRPLCAAPRPDPVAWEDITAEVARKSRGQIAPVRAVEALRAAVERPFDAGLAEERRLFQTLMQSDQRKALIHVFFAERAAGKPPELQGIAPREVETVGVVGGGTMGAGIATALLLAEVPVRMVETSAAAASTARDRIAQNLEGATRRGKLTSAGYEKALGELLAISTENAALASADLVIEAVFEDMAVKQAVFETLGVVCKPGAVLASNTSYLDIDALADASGRAEDVIGLHFFSPAHVMRLLEIVVPSRATTRSVATGFALAKRLGKIAVPSGVGDGFIGNRILSSYRTAADHMVLDGASPLEVDRALTDFGFAMGPYATADLAGLDIGWASRKRRAVSRDPRDRVVSFPDRLCEAGCFGQKSGSGYYDYSAGRVAQNLNSRVLELIAEERAERAIVPRPFSSHEIVNRYMAAMVNAAAQVIEDGIARRPLDVDLVLIAGYGFPRHRGGPCKWADLQGLNAVLTDIEHYAESDAHFWRPAPLLQRLVREGQNFDSLNR